MKVGWGFTEAAVVRGVELGSRSENFKRSDFAPSFSR